MPGDPDPDPDSDTDTDPDENDAAPIEPRSVDDDPDAIPDDGMAPLITNTGGSEGIGDDADAASG